MDKNRAELLLHTDTNILVSLIRASEISERRDGWFELLIRQDRFMFFGSWDIGAVIR